MLSYLRVKIVTFNIKTDAFAIYFCEHNQVMLARYGDIVPSTNNGRIFALTTMIMGTVMYGWLVAVVASTLANSGAAAASFRNTMVVTKQFLAVHDVSMNIFTIIYII